MSQVVSAPATCPHCGNTLYPGDRACRACGGLVYASHLTQLSQQAQWAEQQDPAAAAEIWRQCLALLPPETEQAEMIRQRVALLERVHPRQRSWQKSVAMTVGSMLLSIVVYGWFFGMDYGWRFGPILAAGFVILMLIHEMGHVIALRYYNIHASPPIFIPFVGAVIAVPRMRDALEEAIVGIGGPVLGTAGALLCFALARFIHSPVLLTASFYGFAINLLNLLPIPPLDGGRITAAVSPWIWPFGLLALIGMLVFDFVEAGYNIWGINPIMAILVIYAAPRLWRTFRRRERFANYYKIPKSASRAVGVAYVLLALLLIGMFYSTMFLGVG